MSDGTRDDFALLARMGKGYVDQLPDRILSALRMLRSGFEGYQISSLDHLLQAATRAERDGADEELVVATLLHDIGDIYAPNNHSEFAAAILRPYVSERTHWIIRHHGIFQLYHYGQHIGADNDLRERYRDSAHFTACSEFCERWDQIPFDPAYDSHPLEHFEPALRRVFARVPYALVGDRSTALGH